MSKISSIFSMPWSVEKINSSCRGDDHETTEDPPSSSWGQFISFEVFNLQVHLENPEHKSHS